MSDQNEYLLNSELNQIIPAEIKHDEFYTWIQKISREQKIQTVLEIGSSSGGGSTEAFVSGLRDNPEHPTLFCMEISKPRFIELQNKYTTDSFVKCYNVSSVSPDQFPQPQDVINFYTSHHTALNQYPLEQVLGWLQQDINYLNYSGVTHSGIQKIKTENNIKNFDLVLIDGSEFTGKSELEDVYGAKYILLDDINSYKNYYNYQRLLQDKNYEIIAENINLRNGYAIFHKKTKNDFNFEEEQLEQSLVKRLVRPNMVIFDVGANIGNYSILFSQLVEDQGKVYAFEPTSTTFLKLKQRIENYGCSNVVVLKNAVYCDNTTVDLHEFPEEYAAWNSLGVPQMINPKTHRDYVPIVQTEKVVAVTLDSFCQSHNIQKIDYLKVDVEGAEIDVLKGAKKLLQQRKINWIQFEISQKMLEGLNRKSGEVFEFLKSHNYECHQISAEGGIGELSEDSSSFYENYIAFPSLPIHFFTLVLNGEPFIQYHIDILKQLNFKWHWHIIEGVADLKQDTAWSLQLGGKITDDLHNLGRSKDGTTAYLDQLKQQYPDQITIYRKPEGQFWNGKREMVNAPLVNIQEDCLLWQIDVDELWTVKQICTTRQMFLENPDKTAAWYWCWYFVGENLVISSRNCYAENPQQEWLRTWRFKPGMQWLSHEPPRLVQSLPNGQWQDIGTRNPFWHQETEKNGLVFQHFAYVTPEQIKIKEQYYGYQNLMGKWLNLQQQQQFPVALKQYFDWVKDETLVDRSEGLKINPLWAPTKHENSRTCKIIIDGVFFQICNTGISRVWKSLLENWSTQNFAQQIIVLDRESTAYKIPGIKYYTIPRYNYDQVEEDRQLLQKICDQENADLFISTYYTTPLTTPSVFMGYDMIPEQLGLDLTIPMWREKHHGIKHASAYITISENTAQDLVNFFPNINKNQITVAHCGVPAVFLPATPGEVQQFKFKNSINKPYFILVGQRLGAGGYKNTLLFFKALTQLKNNRDFEIVCVGGEPTLEAEFYAYAQQFRIHLLQLSDQELKQAYSGATALVYPSKYEGFGMPIIEAMACGCPVITCRKGSIPEIAGNAAYYVDEDQVLEMLKALEQIQKPEIYQPLIQAGLQQSSQYSWSKMADIIQQTLIQTVQNLKTSKKSLDFQDFTYSKRSHFNQFKRFKAYININPDACDLKIYQDLLVYNFITQNLPKGSKLLEIGGGNSRVLEALKQDYECWNLDKFEGIGNGPNQIQNYANSRIILDYIGNFNPELPNQYFDCVFSISTLEHIAEDETTFQNITQDMDRILKPLGFSLHCFDVVVKPAEVWINQFLPYLFKTQKTLNSRINFDQIKRDPDLYGMSETSYRQFWQPTTQKSYQEFGQPISYNILWQKSVTNLRSVSPQLIVSSSLPKISIVTPSLNQGEFLEECIDSILSQNYPNLEYIIMDGGSTDNSVEIIKKYDQYLTYWQSQADGGHYAAVNAGFQKTTGEIMGWLNSDDKYHPDAFYKLAATFRQNKQVEWVMGIPTEWDHQGQHIPRQFPIPKWTRKLLLEKQKVIQNQQLQHTWIQQESTFWTRSLWEKAGSKLQTNLNLAGDFELWLRFSRYAPLYLLRSLIGGFRTYDTQRSKIYREQYFQEVKQIVQEELQLIKQGKYPAEQLSPPVIVLEDHQVLALKQQVLTEPKIKVSAIISTYNSASMMSGRLENLVNQTLFQQGKLEIIVVDSGSQENERDIILEFKKQYPDSIIYLKTEAREPIYQAWNRGIAIAQGEYITNQNTDDRLKLNALERLSNYLDEHSDVILVHADQQAVSPGEVVNLGQLNGKPHWKWSEFSRLKLLFSAQVGSQPMWRKSLHHNYGLFDETLKVRGDQDFYIRIANAGKFHFIPEILGTLNLSENSLSHQQDLSREEEILIFKRYTSSREKLAQFLNYPRIQLTDQNYQILVNNLSCDLANQVLSQFHLPFYIKLITELLNSVVELGTYQQTVQTNLLRIWNRFSDPATRFQFMKTLSPQVIEICDEQIQLKGEGMEKIDPVQMYINLSKLSQFNPPKIDPVFSSQPRPFWSVIIPSYNGEKYIEQVLNSVLTQAPSSEEMEIIVVDDFSTHPEIKDLVKKIGKNRVQFYRQPQNLGLIPNWNDCIKRATGQWIHLLHQDDLVLPGFYARMRELLETEPTAGAGFCRHYYIDEQGKQRSLSALEQETSGIISNWLERIAVMQRIQFAAMVVKRSVYETLGGFSESAGSAADWEMWKRISTYYPVAYEPQVLACYRLHSTSESSKLISIGANISDTLKSIELAQSYLPENQAINLSNKAREHYGLYAINTAQQLLANGEAKAVIAQIQEALKCSQSDVVKQAIIELFSPQKPHKAQIRTLTPAQILAEVSHLTEEYKKTNNPDSLRQIRQIVAQYWLALESENLEKTYGGEIGQAHKILLNSGLKNEPLTSLEKAQLQDWYTYLKQGLNQPKSLQHLLAIILYSYPYQLSPNWYIQAPIPKWFLPDYFEFMLAVPQFFQERGETELYYRYLENWIAYIHERFTSHPEFSIWHELAWKFTQMANFIPLYFNTANLKDIYIKRAEIMEFALTHLGYSLDYQFPQRPTRQKIRLGILSNHFLPQTETYSTLPVFEYLDSTQFEVILYALQSNNHPLEQYCQSRAERFVKLPKNISEQVQLIRNDDLDILLIGTNVTAVNHGITLLGLHRLARIQLTSTSSCVTTGMRNMDYYISGTLTEIKQNPQAQYREKLILLEGTAHCFSYYATPPEQPQVIPHRSSLGISEQAVVFISGANFYKIIPELRETWAKLLAKVPDSVLVLYPFNPNWASQYRALPWINNFKAVLAEYGVDPSRLILIKPQGSRSDIKEYLKLADIYLDSYPFSGVNSLVDPLEVGLVPIVRDGDVIPAFSPGRSQAGEVFVVRDSGSFRSLMAASLLRSLSLDDLIANSEEAYINLAITLANNPQLRQQKSQEIQQKMQQNPEFLDSRTYSNKMGVIFQKLFQTWQQNQPKPPSNQLNSREAIQQYLSGLVTHINHYELEPNNQPIVNQLRSIRKIMVEHWLKIPPEQLERMYTTDLGKGYQILLNRGIQRELLTPEEEQFVNQITQQAIGLKQSDALNHLMVLMLYYPPGKMVVANAETRLPEWLLKEYQRVFENPSALEKVTVSDVGKNQPLTPVESFQNRLIGCVNLYKIDPANVAIVEELRQIRRQFADFWLGLETTQLESVYQSAVGQTYRSLLYSGFSQENLTTTEQQFIKTLAAQMNQGLNQIETIKPLLAVLLYCRPEQLQIQDLSRLPQWFRPDYEQLSHQ